MAKKSRILVPGNIATALMFRSDRTCCVCHERGEPIQIHHIDEDPSNNDPDNLAVLCLHCHDETQIKGGFGRKLDAEQVVYYRNDWHRRVAARKEAADKFALAREVGRVDAIMPIPTRRVHCLKRLSLPILSGPFRQFVVTSTIDRSRNGIPAPHLK